MDRLVVFIPNGRWEYQSGWSATVGNHGELLIKDTQKKMRVIIAPGHWERAEAGMENG